ncbi:Zinc finger, C2H2-like protein [Corchorus olitorius]|uniref:Zinc finger, C2H2-like protein n=1 Tax=Corchorus olitorius TaxID=93759 RepID=A0A1R3HNW8_9ROSI|nr:Zinc finger, C2H2-like protein [Corchorus olitorius]
MEQIQEKKFVCKFCHKRFPCGKSLGGHIRTHMNSHNNNENSTEAEEGATEITINKLNARNIKRPAEPDAAAQSSYVLRENPKKTKRFSDSGNPSLLKEMVCKECGKGFQSLKALCGHMACHSEKDRNFQKFEDHSGNSEKQKLIMDSQSDTETSAPSRRRRSRRIRYKAIGIYSNNSVSMANGSSSVSEIEQEQEEVAMCLMMLSRDSGCKKGGGLNSVADSSDNNSVVLEAKSSSIDVRITIKNDMKCVSNGGEFLKMQKPRDSSSKLKSSESGPSSSENSDSGYFRNGPKKVESDVSVDGFLRNVEFKKLKVESGSGFENFDAKFGKNLSKFKCMKAEFSKDVASEVGDNRADHRALTKYDLRRSAKAADYCSPEFFCNSPKGNKYECLTCNKTFDSHRALGGHRASHTKVNDCSESIHESGEDSLANDSYPAPMADSKVTKSSHHSKTAAPRGGSSGNADKRLGSRKNKGHECPFCFRVFKSGQALGGHKRSHFVGGSEDRTVVIKQDPTEMHGLIDLNLPAPVEEDALGNSGFIPW